MTQESAPSFYTDEQLKELAGRDIATAALVDGGADYAQWQGNGGTYRQQLYLTREQLNIMAFPGARHETKESLLAVSVVDAWGHLHYSPDPAVPIRRVPLMLQRQANVRTLGDLLMLGIEATGEIPKIGSDWTLTELQRVMDHFLTPFACEWSVKPLALEAIRALTTNISQVNAAVLEGWHYRFDGYVVHNRPYKHTAADVLAMSDADIAALIVQDAKVKTPAIGQRQIDAIRSQAAELAALYAAPTTEGDS